MDIDDVGRILTAGAHANVKYSNAQPGKNENGGESLMKQKRKDESALCLGKETMRLCQKG